MSTDLQWYALRVKPRSEGIAANFLESQGFEHFLPRYKSRRLCSFPVKILDFPLFPGFVFCKLDIQARKPLLPALPGQFDDAIPTPEIGNLRAVQEAGIPYRPHPFVGSGRWIQIQQGSLAGIRGFLLQTRNDFKLVLPVNLLKRSVAVWIDRSWLEPLHTTKHNVPFQPRRRP